MKYPNQVFASKRKKQTLGVDCKLAIRTDESPLQVHAGFSRFSITIIDCKTGKTITPTANIPAEEVLPIKDITSSVMTAKVFNTINSGVSSNVDSDDATEVVKSTGSSVGYTEKIFILRQYAGQTPVEIIQSGGDNAIKDLTYAKDTLSKNVEKYPKNKVQIDAIDDAIGLYTCGLIATSNITSESSVPKKNQSYTIYETPFKFMTKKNEKGHNLCYSIKISCNFAMDYPWRIEISNLYAPVETSYGGQANIKLSSAYDKVSSSMLLTDMEWLQLIDRLSVTVLNYENLNFGKLYKIMDDNSFKPDHSLAK